MQAVLAIEHFALNTSSDLIQLVTNASLDYESIVAYDITIRAEDNGVPSLYRFVCKLTLLPAQIFYVLIMSWK